MKEENEERSPTQRKNESQKIKITLANDLKARSGKKNFKIKERENHNIDSSNNKKVSPYDSGEKIIKAEITQNKRENYNKKK